MPFWVERFTDGFTDKGNHCQHNHHRDGDGKNDPFMLHIAHAPLDQVAPARGRRRQPVPEIVQGSQGNDAIGDGEGDEGDDDGDGVSDSEDAFPLDLTKSASGEFGKGEFGKSIFQ